MANAVCFSCVKSIVGSAAKPSTPLPSKSSVSFQDPVFQLQSPLISTAATSSRLQPLKAKAEDSNKVTKTSSIVCSDCEGNGAILCSQCKGTGVNSIDHFNGQFKAGGLCWLCRGKRDILCGSCNGAGFLGGFMSTFEE